MKPTAEARPAITADEAVEIVAEALEIGTNTNDETALRRRVVEILCGSGDTHLVQVCAGKCGQVYTTGGALAYKWICLECDVDAPDSASYNNERA